MKKVLIGLVVGISLLTGCGNYGEPNEVSNSNGTEMKLTTDTIVTNQGLATCVVVISTFDAVAPAVDCVWENGER